MSSLQALAQIRNQIADIESQIREIESASLPKADVEAHVKGFVQNLQSRFDAAYIGRCLVGAGSGISTTDILNACSIEETSTADRQIVLAAWLNPDLLEQKLLRAAEPYLATGKQALPADKRPALLRRLDETLSALLVDEEALIVDLEQAGHQVFRRANVDPLVILAATD
jgi:hypothetical protein